MRGLIVDNFAGGGGASTGVEAALGRPVDIAVNHNAEALAMHRANHPDTLHLCENIFAVDPVAVCGGRRVDLAWFSPDCTHHSKAKGGKPRKKNIRGLAWVVVRWARLVRPRVVVLENVEEFRDWGPLTRDGFPCQARKGKTFNFWVEKLRRLGYAVEWRELRACDYGAPTIRKRLFLIARCDGLPIVWPAPTHGPDLQPYRTAADIIDWSIPCPSIFERKRPLAEATCRRIARGIQRFVIDAAEPFIVPDGAAFLSRQFGKSTGSGLAEPVGTVTAGGGGKTALVAATLVQTGYGERQAVYGCLECGEEFTDSHATGVGGLAPAECPMCGEEAGIELRRPGQAPRAPGLNKPLGTVVAGGGKHALVAAFLAQHNTGVTGHDARRPVSTITARGTQQNVVTSHLVKLRGTCRDGQPVDQPMPTVTAGGWHIGEVRAFLIKYYSSGGQWQDCREPLHTTTAKARLGLVTVAGVDYAIADIGMRMLGPRELFRAQGFPDSYIIDPEFNGKPMTKTAQVRLCGNSVCPDVATAIVRANAEAADAPLFGFAGAGT